MNYPTPGTIVNHMPSRLVEAQSARSGADQEEEFRIAILIPCFNEELTIGGVVEAFRRQLSQAAIYVNDNNSTDRTVEVASAAGAICRQERNQGKGNVVRRMFADIEADVYVLVDGDDTYDATSVHRLIVPIPAPIWSMRCERRRSRTPIGRPPLQQYAADRRALVDIRQSVQRYPVRLPCNVAPFREVISCPEPRIRNRDGDHGSRA